MRVFALVLMIALLPLRGWAGEVMATRMAAFEVSQSGQPVTTGNFASNAKPAAAMPDCHGHADSPRHTNLHGGTDVFVEDSANSCSACLACHTVALSLQFSVVVLTNSSSAEVLAAAINFNSATPALSQKPPIS